MSPVVNSLRLKDSLSTTASRRAAAVEGVYSDKGADVVTQTMHKRSEGEPWDFLSGATATSARRPTVLTEAKAQAISSASLMSEMPTARPATVADAPDATNPKAPARGRAVDTEPVGSGSQKGNASPVPVTAAGSDPALRALASGALALRGLMASTLTDEHSIEAARTLKTVALRCKNRFPRHAALALVVSDALAFTEVAALTDRDVARSALRPAFSALLGNFIAATTERQVLDALLEAGWKLTPAVGTDDLSAILSAFKS